MYTYRTKGVCSREIHVDLDGDTIKHVDFVGGCDGNLKAIGKLVNGKNIDDVAAVLEGNTCGRRSTSCADQLVRALREARQAQQAQAGDMCASCAGGSVALARKRPVIVF